MVVVNRLCLGQTLVSNAFIDTYLASADGMFVKVYIMLLRHLEEDDISVGGLAKALAIQEKDVMKALFYWEEQGLISIELENGRLITLEINSPAMDRESSSGVGKNAATIGGGAVPPGKEPHKGTDGAESSPASITDPELRQLLYVTEKFLGRTLTKSDLNFIGWLREDMDFSVDLIEYLIEYCVDRGHTKLSYIKAVALGWKNAGVSTVAEAGNQVKKFEGENEAIKPMKGTQAKVHNFPERTTDLNALLAEELRNGTK